MSANILTEAPSSSIHPSTQEKKPNKPLLEWERIFWELYSNAVETSIPATKIPLSQRIREANLKQLILNRSNITPRLELVIKMIVERANNAFSPTPEYVAALKNLQEFYSDSKNPYDGEVAVIADIRTRYLREKSREAWTSEAQIKPKKVKPKKVKSGGRELAELE